MAGTPKRKARLMLWKNEKDVWYLTLWIPFHGQWTLAKHSNKAMFMRKADKIIAALDLEVERFDGIPSM